MKNIKLSTKLVAGFLFIAVISGIVGVVGIYSLRQITKADAELYTYNTVPLAGIGLLGANFQELRVLFRDASEEQDETRRKEKMTQIDQLRKENAENLKKIEGAVNTPEKKKLLENLKSGLAAYSKLMDKMTGQINSGMGEAAKGVLQTDGLLAARQLNEAISKLFDASVAEAGRSSEKNSSLAVKSNVVSMTLTGVNVVAAILFGFLMTLLTTRPINRAIGGLMGAADQVGE